MTTPVLNAAERLSRVLTHENSALAALDLTRAAGFLAEKQAACEALVHDGADPAAARGLHDLCVENRRLLTRALAVQQRLIGLVADAIPRSDADGRYAASGRMMARPRPPPATLLARA